ncbi:MAG: transaldolase [Terriglobia bacterium]|jgi:transaldolase
MKLVSDLKVKIFADGADKAAMLDLCRRPYISGFTTNPTLMRKAGVSDYEAFAREVLDAVQDRPISFEVLADDFSEMEQQARRIAGWGRNVYVKVPVTNTRQDPALDLIRRLAKAQIHVNVTAVLTLEQVRDVCPALQGGAPSYISVFAGRIADTGRDPLPIMQAALEFVRMYPSVQLIWASPRELFNVIQADTIGCHIITLTTDLLQKLPLVGKDLNNYSQETVAMFYRDALESGLALECDESREVEPALRLSH